MKALIPKPFEVLQNDAIAIDSAVIPSYQEGASYVAGDKVIVTVPANHPAIDVAAIDTIFEAADDVSVSPLVDPLGWINRGAIDAHKMFDKYESTASEFAQNGVLELRAQRCSAAFLGRASGRIKIELFLSLQDAPFWTTIVDRKTAHYEPTSGWYDYFYPELVSEGEAGDTIVEFPASDYDMRARFTALGASGASIGRIALGAMYRLGDTIVNPTTAISDYSVKETDETGETYLKPRSFAKSGSFQILVRTSEVDRVYNALVKLRARPTAWIGDDRFDVAIIYGFYRDFSIVLSGQAYCECSLEIEGLT
ncbi:MAG: hypothetical protein LBO72_08250 [Helicobacteraceae bacterium]|jgi:hypothetical protein|nr:hypothetical protein [Helicobacteraceae bacterium]